MMFMGELSDFRKRLRAEEGNVRIRTKEVPNEYKGPRKRPASEDDITDEVAAIGAKCATIGSPIESPHFRRAGALQRRIGKYDTIVALSPCAAHLPSTPDCGGNDAKKDRRDIAESFPISGMQTRQTRKCRKQLSRFDVNT